MNAFQRVLEKLGGKEKVADVLSTCRALEQHKKLFGYVNDTADGKIALFIDLGYSNNELKQLFKVGGCRLDHIKQELKGHMLLPDYLEDSWME